MKNTTSSQYKDTFIRKLLSEKHRAIEVANALLDGKAIQSKVISNPYTDFLCTLQW